MHHVSERKASQSTTKKHFFYDSLSDVFSHVQCKYFSGEGRERAMKQDVWCELFPPLLMFYFGKIIFKQKGCKYLNGLLCFDWGRWLRKLPYRNFKIAFNGSTGLRGISSLDDWHQRAQNINFNFLLIFIFPLFSPRRWKFSKGEWKYLPFEACAEEKFVNLSLCG